MSIKIDFGGGSFCILLFLLFLTLKLCGIITWSWWWVCAPLWIPCTAVIVIMIIEIIIIAIISLFQNLFD